MIFNCNRIILLLCLFLVFIGFLPSNARAVPAAPDASEVHQPDGTPIEVFVKGDEWINWLETVEGYTIAQDNKANWFYVLDFKYKTPLLNLTPADREPPPELNRHIRPQADSPGTIRINGDLMDRQPGVSSDREPVNSSYRMIDAPYGSFSGSILFILAEFSDRPGGYSESTWGMFISNNINDFFNKSSFGQVSLVPANESYGIHNNGVVGWLDLGYAHPNTGGNINTANQNISKDAIIAADPFIDYSGYDANSDGYVDADELAVVVIVAGYERSYSAAYVPSVWGHKWSISSAPTVDGVIVGNWHAGAGGYAQFGEIHQSNASNMHQATMGIMVHELGHLIFGLPDLYDTDGSSSGIGAWCVMSGGSWGRSTSETYAGERPTLPSAWIKLNRGWVDAADNCGIQSITGAGESGATRSNTVFMAPAGVVGEYFLVENRRPAGYDRGLESLLGTNFGGLAIWHIDDNQMNNTDDAHRLVDLEEADGTPMGITRGEPTDLWYPGNAITFDDASNPNSKLYSGATSGISINDISPSAAVVNATLEGCTQPPIVLWNQTVSSAEHSVSANQDFETVNDAYDIFLSDDFTNTVTWEIGTIFIPGNTWNPGCDLTCATTLHFMIYEDNAGVPAGYPDGGLGGAGRSPIWVLSIPPSDLRVTLSTGLGGYLTNVTLNLTAPINLPPGTYWLVYYPEMEFGGCCQYGRHVSDTTNGNLAQVVNPGGGFGLPAAWTSAQYPYTLDLEQQDFAFRLEGSIKEDEEFPWVLFLPTILGK